LFLDEELLKPLSPDILVELPERWKALQIYIGENSLDETGWVQRLSQPLSNEGINMLYLSTYHFELIFVEEHNQGNALSLLQNSLNKDNGVPKNPNYDNLSVEPSNELLEIISFQRKHMKLLSHALLRLFLDIERSDTTFFSFLSCTDEITLVVPKCHHFGEENQASVTLNSSNWNSILISAGEGGFEKTILNVIARVLANHNISIYYLSTCGDDFILVQDFNLAKAVRILESLNIS